jgi:hypothetical protein
MMSDSIKFEVDDNQFKLSGHGDTDVAEIDINLMPDAESIQDLNRKCAAVLLEVSNSAEAKYGSEFIRYVNRFTPSECFELDIAEDYPLRINANRGKGHIPTEIIIAPRMDNQ